MHIPEEWGINAGDNWEGMQFLKTKSSQLMKQCIKPIILPIWKGVICFSGQGQCELAELGPMLKSVLGNSHFSFQNRQFLFFMPLCENQVCSCFFYKNRGLTRTMADINKIPTDKNPVLRLGSSQQFEKSQFS